jgi:hypothetical protein
MGTAVAWNGDGSSLERGRQHLLNFLLMVKRLRRKLTEIALKIEDPLRLVSKQHCCFLLQAELLKLTHKATHRQHNADTQGNTPST